MLGSRLELGAVLYLGISPTANRRPMSAYDLGPSQQIPTTDGVVATEPGQRTFLGSVAPSRLHLG